MKEKNNENNIILSLRNITKTYPGVTAIDNVSINFKYGEVHALIGENGAGKSTLINIIAGATQPDDGEIYFDGNIIKSNNPMISKMLGICVIYQELNLVPNLSAVENLYLGNYLTKGIVIDKKMMKNNIEKLFDSFNTDVDIHSPISTISTAKQQLVEIAKALSQNVKLLIMDEPTSSLTNTEVKLMYEIIEKLKKQGITIIYITHRMDEIFEISERVSIFRDGKYIETKNTSTTNRKELIELMVGRKLTETYPVKANECGKPILDVRNLCGNGDSDISFQVKAGEILGFAGLVGSGRTEIAKVIFGAAKKESGDIYINNEKVNIKSPKDAIKYGIGLISEDRKQEGLILDLDITKNISLANIKKIGKLGIINNKYEAKLTETYKDKLSIKTPYMKQIVKKLSGGNQQKVVLAKWLLTESEILIFDEPTRGIDVGAKQEIYKLMCELADDGKAIIMISSDMEELLGMSDRLLVFYKGKLNGEFKKSNFDQTQIMSASSGNLAI